MRSLLAPALGALLSGLLSLPLLTRGYGFDQAIYASLAEIMRAGGAPYRDAWEMRPPGAFYLYALASLLFGKSMGSIRILEILALAAAGAGLARIGERRFGSRAAGLAAAAALPLLYVPFDSWHTAQPESFQIPLIVWALALWPAEDDDRRPRLRSFLSGLLLGAATLCKTTALLLPLLALADRLVQDLRKPDWREKLQPALATLAGIVSLPALLLVGVAAAGALPAMFHALFVFAPRYAAAGLVEPVPTLLDRGQFFLIEIFTAPALLLSGVGLVTGILGRRRQTLRWAAFGLASALSVVAQLKFYKYHYLPLAPFLALLIGLSLIDAGRAFRPVLLPARAAALLGALLLAAAWGIQASRRAAPSWRALAGRPAPECDLRPDGTIRVCDAHRAAAAVASRTNPGDPIFIWGNDPLVYVLAGRRPAGPHVYIGPVLAPWVGDAFETALLDRLRAAPPRLIVTVRGDALPWFAGPPEDSEQALERFTRMRDFIRSHYSEVETVGRHRLWARSGS